MNQELDQSSVVEWLKKALEVSGTQIPDIFYETAKKIEDDQRKNDYVKGRRDYINLVKKVVEEKPLQLVDFINESR
jgi:hypothetical protein